MITGPTGLTYVDTGVTQGQLYFYKVVVVDHNNTTVSTVEFSASAQNQTFVIGFIGDSITSNVQSGVSYSAAQATANRLQQIGAVRQIILNQQALSGTDTSQWISGSQYLTTAKAGFAAAGVTHVVVMFGTNDCRIPCATNTVGHRPATGPFSGTDGATPGINGNYQTNMISMVNDLVASGYKVILNACTYSIPNTSFNGVTWDDQAISIIPSYNAVLQTISNGTTIFVGDTHAYEYFANHTNEFFDGVHPNQLGADSYGMLWAEGFRRNFIL